MAYTTLFAVCECVWARLRHKLPQPGQGFSPCKVGRLLLACFALALVTSLQYYLTNAPKYAIDARLDDLRQAYYGYLAMPTFIKAAGVFSRLPKILKELRGLRKEMDALRKTPDEKA